MNKAYFKKEAGKLKELCRQRKLARESARQEAKWLMSDEHTETMTRYLERETTDT